MSDFLDPSKAVGTVFLSVVAGVALVAVLAGRAWIVSPLKWWFAGRALKRILLSGRSFSFVFNPATGQAKLLTFLANGEIGEGQNTNEHSWRIHHGTLEIFAFDGLIYSRFVRDKKLGKLVHTNDPDTRSIHGQYMQPNFKPWPDAAAEQRVVPDAQKAARR